MRLKNVILLSQFICFFSLFSIVGCYEPIDGCLDLRADNYSLLADNGCDDCCTFPDIRLTFVPMWDDEALDTDTVYTTAVGDSFSIVSSAFLVSNILLLNEEDSLVSQNSIEVDCGDGVFYDSFSSISLSSRLGTSSSVPLAFGFNEVQFDLGVSDCLAQNDTLQYLNTLESADEFLDSRFSEQEFISAQILLETDSDTLELLFLNTEWSEQLNLAGDFEIRPGFNLNLDILVDYRVLLQTVSLNQPNEGVKNDISQNVINAFTLEN